MSIVTYQGSCYPADCDHMGHMNVASYVRKFDEATWILWAEVGMTRKVMDDLNCGLAAMESKLTYAREVFPGDAIRVRSRLVELNDKTARFRHEMFIQAEDGMKPAATCEYLVACLDRAVHRARPFPDDVCTRVESHMAELGDGGAAAEGERTEGDAA